MDKRKWEPFLFSAVATATALSIALRALFVPFHRLQAKAGGWNYAWEFVSERPGRWAAAVLVRLLVGLLLFWIALRCRRRGIAAGYWAMAGAALAIVVIDFILFAQFHFG